MMNRTQWKLPIVELALVPIILLVGWVAYELHQFEILVPPPVEPAMQPGPRVEKVLQAENLTERARQLEVDYNTIGNGITERIEALYMAITSFVSDSPPAETPIASPRGQAATPTPAPAADGRRQAIQTQVDRMRSWLSLQQDRADRERFDTRFRELKDFMAREQPAPPGSEARLTTDLSVLLDQAEMAFNRFSSNVSIILRESGSAPVKSTAERLALCQTESAALRALGAQALDDARSLKAFLATRPPPAIESAPIAADSTASKAADLRRAQSQELQKLFYATALALIGLAVVLATSFYRHTVVAPLRFERVEREANEKLKHFGTLSSTLAHEIGQPLTAITARLWTLQKGLKEGTDEHSDATIIRQEIQRLNQILKDFRRLARPSPPRLAPLHAGAMLDEIQMLLAPQLAPKSIELKTGEVADLEFEADPQQLKQVLFNLINNASDAIQHAGSAGVITLGARGEKERLNGHPTRAVVLEVADNGPGIPPEVRHRLFDPFYSTKEEGTGLGLAIASKIIEQHGGRIDFDTKSGEGTVFRVVLPVSRAS